MGSFISRFKRKAPTTVEQLIKIEESLKKIKDYRRSTEQKQKRTVANIVIYGAALYVLACVIVFVWYLPESWLVRLGILIPFMLVPFIIYGMKRLISGYFNSKMIKANKEYEDLQQKKKDIIDNIMEKETFNKAKEILSKYAPEKLGRRDISTVPQSAPESKALVGPVVARPSAQETSNLRRRFVEPEIVERKVDNQMLAISPTRSIPRPMFSRNRGFTDKLIEYIVGDGPGYRFALICRHCNGHNGMALQEEFLYVAYNCCYCLKFNPARSQRPLAPPLEASTAPRLSLPGIIEATNDEQNVEEDSSNLGPSEDAASTNDTDLRGNLQDNNDEQNVEEDSSNLGPSQDVGNVNDEQLRGRSDEQPSLTLPLISIIDAEETDTTQTPLANSLEDNMSSICN